jgi:cytochrome b
MIKVWDPVQRLFHWSLVAAIAIAWLTAEASGTSHEWVGYFALGLIGFRVIWGLIGTCYARFAQFIRGPQQVIGYARDMLRWREKRYVGHNPLGALMVIALLGATAAAGFTGWLVAEPERIAMLPEMPNLVAPAFADSDGREYGAGMEGVLEETHEFFASLLVFLISLHVVGVIYTSRRHKENLARAMVTGKKPATEADDII